MSVAARCIDRIGLPAFLEAMGIDPDPNMILHPRTSSYVRTDDFSEEAAKYFERKAKEAGLTVAARISRAGRGLARSSLRAAARPALRS